MLSTLRVKDVSLTNTHLQIDVLVKKDACGFFFFFRGSRNVRARGDKMKTFRGKTKMLLR